MLAWLDWDAKEGEEGWRQGSEMGVERDQEMEEKHRAEVR